jgi:predicted RNA-binding protein with EMAP domain
MLVKDIQMTEEEIRSIESGQKQFHEEFRHEADMIYYQTRLDYQLFEILRPRIYLDGNQWCVLLGENLSEGIAGFGDTPYLAVLDFNKCFYKTNKKDSSENN